MSSAAERRCPSCRHLSRYWEDYWCPGCGQHFDHLYCLEATDPRPRSRDEIADEYAAAGLTDEARRLRSLPAVTTPYPNGTPAPATAPTAFVQRHLLELLESA